MKVLGTSIEHSEYVDAQLRHITAEHQIPLGGFLMSRFCNALGCCFSSARQSRPNYVLKVLLLDATREFRCPS